MAPGRLEADDRRQLADLISRYAHAVDRRTVADVVACFSPDARVDFDGGALTVRGRDALTEFFQAALTDPATASDGCTHLMSNVLLDVDGDGARGETSAVAFHVYAGQGHTVIRGLHYSDRFVRSGQGWLVRHRRHRVTWQSAILGLVSATAGTTTPAG